MRTQAVRDIMGAARMGWDEPWGTVQAWWFATAEVLYFEFGADEVPVDWEYRPSPCLTEANGDDYETSLLLDAVECGATADDLRTVGAYFTRYSALCKLAGVDY